MISKLAMLAKKTIEAAWLNGSSYDLATQAAEALESAQLLQSPETAAEQERLRTELAQRTQDLADTHADRNRLRVRIAELEAEAGTNYCARWDSIPLGQYTNQAEARKHCEDHARRDLPTAAFDWIEDEEDGIAELVATIDGDEGPTGYTVTALEVASKYDPEADE
ncbi:MULTISPECIES: hypothetical protein [unclassified Streptomyces]|uniref:hypothetical protein n=1 Tax=unclassified Streptomyces TaxID=2593676 RepID=UPI0033AE5BBC